MQSHNLRCYRGGNYIDGSLTDFLNSNNSDLLLCDGEALILDYYQVHLLFILPKLASGLGPRAAGTDTRILWIKIPIMVLTSRRMRS